MRTERERKRKNKRKKTRKTNREATVILKGIMDKTIRRAIIRIAKAIHSQDIQVSWRKRMPLLESTEMPQTKRSKQAGEILCVSTILI